VVLLFAQLATAAYACPRVASDAQAALAMAQMPGCDGHGPGAMDPDQPQLCRAHCEQGSQTVNPASAIDLPMSPVLLAVLDWSAPALMPAGCSRRFDQAPSGASPPGTPPLYLSLLVLRN
jgi:hypothetical protein